ncbi:MAG: ribbon-helix-helix protein, CopG family [bacterium]
MSQRPKVDFRADPDILDAVDAIADELECSRSAVIRRALKKHVQDVAKQDAIEAQIDLEEYT